MVLETWKSKSVELTSHKDLSATSLHGRRQDKETQEQARERGLNSPLH